MDANVDVDLTELDTPVEQGKMQVTARFDEVILWGHHTSVDAEADPYIRGIEEWLEVSEKVRQYR